MLNFKCQFFCIVLYLVLNLTPNMTFVKFNAKFEIALENDFYGKMPNFDVDTQIFTISLEMGLAHRTCKRAISLFLSFHINVSLYTNHRLQKII